VAKSLYPGERGEEKLLLVGYLDLIPYASMLKFSKNRHSFEMKLTKKLTSVLQGKFTHTHTHTPTHTVLF
jgi:hypothetical protein